jgi:hypothetical protein
MPPRLRQIAITLVTQVLVALAACAYIAATCRIPLPVALPVVAGEAFPCQVHQCGCVSAEACRTQCCCFTPAERIAWAEDHHDAALLAAARRELSDALARSAPGCLAPGAVFDTGDACCSKKPAGGCQECADVNQEGRAGLVELNLVRRCRGLQEVWLVCFVALPQLPRGDIDALPRVELFLAGTASIDSRTVPPPDPPPERALPVC